MVISININKSPNTKNRTSNTKNKSSNTKNKSHNTKNRSSNTKNKSPNNKSNMLYINPSYKTYEKTHHLIIICAGDESLHYKKKWYGKSRKYVLCVIYFGDNKDIETKYRETSDILVKNKGPKWSLIRSVLMNWKNWKQFKFIAFPDDDLDISISKLNSLFELGQKHRFDLFQPALIDNGPEYVKHGILKVHNECKFRYTDFVEIMIPIFSIKALHKSYKLLTDPNIKSAWGIDYIIPGKILKRRNVAVVDSVPITHTKPLGALDLQKKSSFYKKYNIDPEKEMWYFLNKYHLRPYQQRTLKCVKI